MIDFLLAEANNAFSISIGIVVALGLIEGIGLLIGLSMMALLDNLSPIDIDLDADADLSVGGLTQIVGWLCLNKLPLMIWLVLFLTAFAVSGYTVNFVALTVTSALSPAFISIPVALAAGLVITSKTGSGLARIMPKNESSAVSTDSFAGRIATVTSGTARSGSPAEAALEDDFHQKHYVLVEPMEQEEVFPAGQKVLLIEKGSNGWLAVRHYQ